MLTRKQAPAAPVRRAMDPFALLRQMAAEFDRTFDWPSFSWPAARSTAMPETAWCPKVDMFQKDNRFVTRVDLPGLKKEDVSLEVMDGYLKISGERKYEFEEERDEFYRSEREYGKFFRTIPLPEGVNVEDIRAVFADGVLEVSVPLPVRAEAKPRKVAIEQPEPARPEMASV
jgi:HSP20 family protein